MTSGQIDTWFGQHFCRSSEERPFQAVTVKEGVLMTENEGKEEKD